MTTPVEFAERCAAAAADLALALAHEPDDRVATSLEQMRANLEAKLSKVFANADAVTVAKMFVAAVVARRREIEKGIRK